jgi:WD40 repeat protein
LASWLAAVGLLIVPPCSLAQDAVQLVAGEPTLLNHPQINDSVGNPVLCLAFLPGGTSLATGATSGVLVWDTTSGDLQQTLEVDERAVDSLALDPRGTLLVAGGASGVIKVWDARTLKPLHTLGPTPGAVRGLAISPDGRWLATASPNGQLGTADSQFGVLLWDLATGRQVRKIPHPAPDFGTTVLAFLPDGKQLVSAQDRAFRVIDLQQGEVIKTIEKPELPRSLGSMALAADGRRLATGVFEPKVRVWDTQSWQQVLAWDAHDQLPPPQLGVASVGISADGRFVLTAGMDGLACVWAAATGRRLLELNARGEGSRRWLTGIAMTPDTRLLAASHYGGTATLWRISEK